MEEILDFLKKAGVWYLATDEDGQPRVRPFGSQMIYKGKLYFETGLKKNVAKQLLKSPKVEICAMLEAIPELKKMYAAGDGNTAVFYLKNAKAVISGF